jgi:uroporphyrinogen decarboxylase
MTSRERVELALARKEPDRVPLDLWGSASRITNELYFKVAERLGYEDHPPKIRPGKTAEYVDYRISDFVGADFRHTVARSPKNFKAYKDERGVIYDEWGIGYRMIDQYAQIAYHPLATAVIADIDAYQGPRVEDEGRLEGLADEARDWHDNTDYYITATAPCSGLALDYCFYLRGQEQFFVDMYTDPAFTHKLLDKVSEIIARLYVYYIRPVAEYIGWVEYESDYGMQTNAWLPREKYREFIKKPNAKVFDAVRNVAPHAKVFLHSCGAIRELIPELIDNGIEILNSLQPGARGMNSFEIKKEFGRDLIFHGGVDIQGPICGTVEEAVTEAKTRIQAFAPGGGYVFASTNHFQPDTPVENFFAIYKTAIEYGRYPIADGP